MLSENTAHPIDSATEGHLPLSTLLSQTLVAFTIEFDNEFERQMPHRTTSHGSTADSRGGPWLVSLVMWSNCMRFVGDDGVTVSDLKRRARTGTNLDGMRRWGYITIEPDTAGSRSKRPRPDALLRPTQAGRQAQEVWRPLFGIIEERWQERFGEREIDQLRQALWDVAGQLDSELPDCLPILGFGLLSRERNAGNDGYPEGQAEEDGSGSQLPLSALLSRVLLAFAVEFERESAVSLAICANVLRLVGRGHVRVRDLPRLAGVSKQAIAMAQGFLEKQGYAVVAPEAPGSRVKALTLTPKGRQAQDTYRKLLWSIEGRWRERFGEQTIGRLRDTLEPVVVTSTGESPLFQGLEPYPDGWRAAVSRPDTLPHYPMVLHRGGFPDGS
jgi:DNA-binding MarR family transcriptional regulator